jgi:DNA/RNA-binding domain of Phe-tRNA-synthetase-like protein
VYFEHATGIWHDYPELVPGVLFAEGISTEVSIATRAATFAEIADERLAAASEAELPEIQAWRRAFSRMGLEPTRYRSAAEALLRRYRREGSLPRIHPLIDLCNAISLAFAIPVAVFDTSRITDYVEVRYASGCESYSSFSGETESPEAGEVIFADADGQAHARRWVNRQSALSAVRDSTTTVLIVAEAMHDSASADVVRLVAAIADELGHIWSLTADGRLLSPVAPRFEFP